MAANTLAYGFTGLAHLNAERVSGDNIRVVWTAIQESLSEYTRDINGMLGGWVARDTIAKERFELPGSGTLQPIDEWSSPRPVREAGYYDVAYPIQGGGTAFGENRVAAALMTIQEANRRMVESMRRDADWMRRHMLAAVFDNVAWTYNDAIGPGGRAGLGSVSIQPLANGDTVTYNVVGGTTATDTHYLAQANSIDDSNNPFATMYDELMEHPSNSGPVVAYVPTALTSAIEALTNYTPIGDTDLAYGVNVTQIRSPIDRGLGDEVLGKVDKVWIIEWRALPSTHMICVAQGAGPFMVMREYDAAQLQGFFTESQQPDVNGLSSVAMLRYCGFGIRNRIAALVQRIGNGSYGIPSGYDAPLAI